MATTFYAVATGHMPGIYEDWPSASEQVTGYPGAVFQRFRTREEAEGYLAKHQDASSEPSTTSSLLTTLTTQQQAVLYHLLMGKNVALLGAAGCGKSYLLSVLYTEFPGLKKRTKGGKLPRIQICAMTGCAALLLDHKAKTLHSWAGIGLGKGTVGELYTKIRRNTKSMRHWLCTDVLVIDEVSMMTAELLDKLNELGKKTRGNKRPFGGIQVVLVGDFYQLPPVNKGEEATMFAFEADAWKEAVGESTGNGVVVELTEIQRQKDPAFQTILKEARMGALSWESCNVLRERQGLEWKSHKIRPTLIFPRRAEVDMINDTNLRALKGRRYTYKARLAYDGKMPEGFTEKEEGFVQALKHHDSNAPYLVELELALNAQVMLIANAFPEQGLVNGSRGVVVDFCSQTDLPIVEFVNGVRRPIGHHAWPIEEYEFVSRSQVPLRLAYAATCHKVQGSTLDAALIDIGAGIFEYGQAYVALSRVKSIDALYVHDFDPSAFRVHPKVLAFYKGLAPALAASIEEGWLGRLVSERMEESKEEDVRSVLSSPSKAVRAITVSKIESVDDSVEEPGASDAVGLDKMAAAPTESMGNWLYDSVPADWKNCLSSCEAKLLELSSFLGHKEFLPRKDHVWTALTLTAMKDVKVVILGQDPYPTPGNAHGLAFSVLPDIRPVPASLKNIYKELASDVGFTAPTHGYLEEWAKRGVLLLNTVLTVEAGAPQSHAKIGWEEVTDQILRSVAAQTEGVVFVLWGKSAQAKKGLLNLFVGKNKHRIFESAHPSPLSAHKGFFGTRPFSTVNQWLVELGKAPVEWQLT
jgi:uracil-DNA glycosylase